MKQIKYAVGGGLFVGTTLWIWSNNRERSVVFYSPEEFEQFTKEKLKSFDIDEAVTSGQSQWLSRLKYNWFSDVPLIIETTSVHRRKEKFYELTVDKGLLWTNFSIEQKEGPVLLQKYNRTIYKCVTRMSKEELGLLGLNREDRMVKWSRDYHTKESFSEFIKTCEENPERQWKADAKKYYPRMSERIRERCKDDRHIKIKMIYRERLSPFYLLKLCGFE